jgi:hypothetical protein
MSCPVSSLLLGAIKIENESCLKIKQLILTFLKGSLNASCSLVGAKNC